MRAMGISRQLKRLALFLVFSVSTGSAAVAQTPQAVQRDLQTTLRPGMTVWITDALGREEKAQIVDVSADIVTSRVGDEVRRRRADDVMQVSVRRSDSLLNGALIGAGAAVASGLFLCRLTEPWENCRDDVGPMLKIGAIGAGIGIGIDALFRQRTTIYGAGPGSRQVRIAPIVARRAGGLQVSLSF